VRDFGTNDIFPESRGHDWADYYSAMHDVDDIDMRSITVLQDANSVDEENDIRPSNVVLNVTAKFEHLYSSVVITSEVDSMGSNQCRPRNIVRHDGARTHAGSSPSSLRNRRIHPSRTQLRSMEHIQVTGIDDDASTPQRSKTVRWIDDRKDTLVIGSVYLMSPVSDIFEFSHHDPTIGQMDRPSTSRSSRKFAWDVNVDSSPVGRKQSGNHLLLYP
jgi:hypothetical protein